MKTLIEEINQFFTALGSVEEKNNSAIEFCRNPEFVQKTLSPWSAARFNSLPDFTQKQLVLERDVHGGVQLSQIETERLLAHLVSVELKERKSAKQYKGGFSTICHFFGYQGRCALPSLFDCSLAST